MTLLKLELYKLFKKKISWVIPLLVILAGTSYLLAIRQFSEEVPGSSDYFGGLMGLPTLMNLGIVVIASGILSAEFSQGTIKFLLVRPYKRKDILFTKFLVMLIYTALFSLLLFVSIFLLSSWLLKYESPLTLVQPFNMSAIELAVKTLGINFFLVIFYVAIAFLLQTLARSQALAVGFGVAFLFGSSILNMLSTLIMTKYSWFKWNPLNFLSVQDTLSPDYVQLMKAYPISQTETVNLYVSTGQMIVGLILTSAVIYFLSQLIFQKRDVTLS